MAILAAALVAAAAPAAAEEPNLYIAPSAWLAGLSGSGQTGTGSSVGRFDLENTAGLDTTETSPSFEGFLRVGPSRLIVGWNRSDYSGDGRLGRALQFMGRSYPSGVTVHSKLDYDRRRVLYGRPFVDTKTVAAGFLLGLESYEIDLGIRTVGVGYPHAKIDSVVPLLGASLVFQPTNLLRIYGEASGMSMERGGVDSRILQLYAVAEYIIASDFLAVSAGYRYLSLVADEDGEVRFDCTQRGFFTGLVFRF